MEQATERYSSKAKLIAFKEIFEKIKLLHKEATVFDTETLYDTSFIMGEPLRIENGAMWRIYTETFAQKRYLIFWKKQVRVIKNMIISAIPCKKGDDDVEIKCTIHEKTIYEKAVELIKDYCEKYDVTISIQKGFTA